MLESIRASGDVSSGIVLLGADAHTVVPVFELLMMEMREMKSGGDEEMGS